ncbi:fam-h protein [Plasmodium relictum]|uniref:Fam-h protein n=1 Tax=Plasmodium relictum TaxID=85471 RepID=A0A1J1GK33_PLARL|nr:fam-h protein [Plasmodium relictum]CRG84686.1 fam-h protein [Plasmodium relictum]
MNRKSDSILNIRMHPMFYYHVSEGFITTDISTLKLYSKREKKNILYFLMKFFLFTFLIWILQYSNNWVSYKSRNQGNSLKNVLNLGYERSLAESNNTIKQTKEGLNYYDQQNILETYLESRNEQNEIEENIDVEQENEIKTKEKNKKVSFNKSILGTCKSNLKLVLFSLFFFMPFSSFMISLISLISSNFYDEKTYMATFLLSNISIIIFAIYLIYEQINIKRKIKL